MITDDELAALQTKHTRVALLDFGDDAAFVVRAPTLAEQRVLEAQATSGHPGDAMRDYVRRLVVWCNGTGGAWVDVVQAFDRMVEMYPSLPLNKEVTAELGAFAGTELRRRGKASPLPAKSSG